jgi:type II secretory pathway component PulC
LDLALNNLAVLAGAVRVAPEMRDGRPVGFRLFAVAADGPFAQLGLRDEDVLVAINHLAIATAEQVLEAYGKLKTAKHLVLGVLRGGRKTSLEYTIR